MSVFLDSEDKTVVLSAEARDALKRRVLQQQKIQQRRRLVKLGLAGVALLIVLALVFEHGHSHSTAVDTKVTAHTQRSQLVARSLDVEKKLAGLLAQSDIGCTEVPLGQSKAAVLWQNPMIKALVDHGYLNLLQFNKQIVLSETAKGKSHFEPIAAHEARFCYAKPKLESVNVVKGSSAQHPEVVYSYQLVADAAWLTKPTQAMGPTLVEGNKIHL